MTSLRHDHYAITLMPDGCGQSICDGRALNRWSEHPIGGPQGFFLYLRDASTQRVWSAMPAPCFTSSATMEHEGVIWKSTFDGIQSKLEVQLDAQRNFETRVLSLTNMSVSERGVEITSFLEAVLLDPRADAGHPAFAKLFVQTSHDPATGALLANRRPRANDEYWPCIVHGLAGATVEQCETDRAQFIGRGRDARHPAALLPGSVLSNTVGNVLDACLSLRTAITLAPSESITLRFYLGMARDRDEALQWAGEWLQPITRGSRANIPLATAKRSPTKDYGNVEESELASQLHFFNGHGGFTHDGGEHVVLMPWVGDAPLLPPMPWINVIGHEGFGVLISEKGAACTWSRNSQANRLTPWSNDPVSDPHGESFLVRDDETGALWSPLAGPMPAARLHEARHGFGSSSFRSSANGVGHELTWCVPDGEPVRVLRWNVRNVSHRRRTLTLIAHEQLALGTQVAAPGSTTVRVDAAHQLLHTRHAHGSEFAGPIVFSSARVEGGAWAGGGGAEDEIPCFTQRLTVTLAPQQEVTAILLLGEARDDLHLRALLRTYRDPAFVDATIAAVSATWRARLDVVKVRTPLPEVDVMVNGWLAYQSLVCRLQGRSAFYQSSGALGFRDQLQDAMNLLLLDPVITRQQLLRHAGRQFAEGDVMHWWHDTPIGRGMRTRFSDDLLWLALATARYVQGTGDAPVLDEALLFLEGPPLGEGQEENYLPIKFGAQPATLFDHCCRALDRSLALGAHGLPFMGTGDWNDGMNRVGRLGTGESVWMGFFLHHILGNFIPLCEQRGEGDRAARYAAHREALHHALNTTGWDGEWYRRAYFDDGTPLGSKLCDECQIDGLSQSWAAVSGVASEERVHSALDAAMQRLVDDKHGITKLLTPAFVNTPHDPGYIKGYVAGVRENGGQYTHAACWMVQALAEAGRRDEAARLLQRLSPVWHTRSPQHTQRYKVEPYVIAADIYGEPPHIGRGGWTWYTGSAAWMFRVAVESVLGLTMDDGRWLILRPRVPDSWPFYSMRWRSPGGAIFLIEVLNPDACAETVIFAEMDDQAVEIRDGAARVPIPHTGEHQVKIVLGE